ncbi:cytochrome p450 superfamily protein [Mucor ambiguus]|uniref:Cytochrome p450 superfamily protein n=1 Tax=Mucor ambiguus TaxID=91626 RepID=A0A0C9LTK3_9FUNG|nr:cytochrome p450 superfamily protein [Mucor ambiguus]
MDYLQTISQSTPIHNAIRIIQNLPLAHKLEEFYKRASRNELMFVGAAAFLTLYNLKAYINAKRQKLNLPPYVPYGLPLLGHTLYLMASPFKFVDWCNKNYGEIYDINLLGKTVTVTSKKCAEETFKAESSDLSLNEGIVNDMLHLNYLFTDREMILSSKANAVVVRAVLTSQRVPLLIPTIQEGLERGANVLLKSNEPTIVKKPSIFFQNYVAYMSVGSLIGEEIATNTEVIQSFAQFTGDIIGNVSYFVFLPKFMHSYILPFLQTSYKHHHVMEKYVMPMIAERREKLRLARQVGKEDELERDFLHGLAEYVYTDEDGKETLFSEKELAHNVLMVAFAAVHTTSTNLSYCIYWLIARPDLKQKLLEEINRVTPGKSRVTHQNLLDMPFLNNFVRESLRQSVDRLAVQKKVMHDYTYYNGYQVPKGRMIHTTTRSLNFGETASRSSIEDMNPDMSNNKPCSAPARDFLTFGMGKHLCPGRFFAIQEIMMSLVYLMKNYDFDTVSGKKPHPVSSIANITVTNCEEPLVFTPRN